MIGLDTNVLVRYFAQDDPIQSPRATELIEHRLTAANPGFISTVVIAEIVWVLERAYKLPAVDIATIVERLLQAPTLVIDNESEVFTALAALQEGHGFADALIGALGTKAGCSATLTFDRSAARLPGFALA
jgi:predicted nucleic-acid-binding protein